MSFSPFGVNHRAFDAIALPPRLPSLNIHSIQERIEYQQASATSGGKSVTISTACLYNRTPNVLFVCIQPLLVLKQVTNPFHPSPNFGTKDLSKHHT